jgi:hypothetical protein
MKPQGCGADTTAAAFAAVEAVFKLKWLKRRLETYDVQKQ